MGRTSRPAVEARAIAPGVYWLPTRACNVYLIGSSSGWVLIDAGWRHSGEEIRLAAAQVFGPSEPAAILLTHAHPDHFGSVPELLGIWESPVYVHRDDLPYLEGGPLPDRLLDPVGRVFKVVQRVVPQRTADRLTSSPLKGVATALPVPEGRVPHLPDWDFIHIPGHSPGHVIFFRRRDRVLIAGDAVLTAPLWGLLAPVQRLSSPPWMVSWDWELTKAGVLTILELGPLVLASGHGRPIVGEGAARALARFAERFSPEAIPVPAKMLWRS
jgi:glyoxylase-like metal-dependent hydrolase (beta-lactamase superfamily II)